MYEEELEVLYAGDAPGIVTAVSQINVRLPAAWPGLPAQLRITVGGALSEPVRIWVRP